LKPHTVLVLVILTVATVGVAIFGQRTAYGYGSTLYAGEWLYSAQGQYLTSPNGIFRLLMQTDGNLVLYDGSWVLWHSGTYNVGPVLGVTMQTDGNLVIYSPSLTPLWHSNTHQPPPYTNYRLEAQSDGNVVIYTPASAPLWSTNTWVQEPYQSYLHLAYMHDTNAEDFCALIEDGSIGLNTAATRIRATLHQDDASHDWDGLAVNKVFFIAVSLTIPCNQLANRANIQIEYWVHSSGCGGVSCQWFTSPTISHNGRQDYLYAYVRFKTSHISGSTFLYHHVINHETGHILGLADPPYGDCKVSVMHSAHYGCTDREWPQSGDRVLVTDIANYARYDLLP